MRWVVVALLALVAVSQAQYFGFGGLGSPYFGGPFSSGSPRTSSPSKHWVDVFDDNHNDRRPGDEASSYSTDDNNNDYDSDEASAALPPATPDIIPDRESKCGTQLRGQCRAKSRGCNSGEWRSGFCSGDSICCAPFESTLDRTRGTEVVISKGEKSVKRFRGAGATIWYRAPMEADADGSLMAYHPVDIGIDKNANGGWPGKGYGLAFGTNGRPCVQGPNDPCPGFFISGTAIARSWKKADYCKTNNWANSDKIPYMVLPRGSFSSTTGAGKGDLAIIVDSITKRGVYSWVADMGPEDKLGEAATATILAFGSSPFSNGRLRCGASPATDRATGNFRFTYIVFSGSRAYSSWYDTYADLAKDAERAYINWGGAAKLKEIVGFDVKFVSDIPAITSLNPFTERCGLPLEQAAKPANVRWTGCRATRV